MIKAVPQPYDADCATGEWVPVDRHQVATLARSLKALAHPVRLEILAILARAGGPLCVCELEKTALRVKQPTVSHHLRLLRESGLIESEQRGVWVYYSVRPARLVELWAWLSALTLGPSGASHGSSD